MGKTRYRALLIGNARFEKDPHNLPALKGPPEDLKILERALTADGTGIHEAADVKTLLDGTKPELSEAIDDFFQTAGAGDQLLLYYSGHGRQDAYNNLYLCARDTRTDRLNSSAVADSEISQMIRNSRAARTVIVLDCCHSGSFKGGGMPEALANAGGRFLLTSCRDQQLATDAGETGGASAFTSHLVQALIAGEVDANEDGYVTLTEVYHHILPKLKIATQQIPQLHFDKTVGDPPLGKVVAKKAEATVVGTGMVAGASEVAARPVLAVSDSKIELHDVHVGEQLPPVTIDVFNEGGGELDWTATSEEGWIAIEAGKRFFKVSFTPKKAGAHRGNIYVRDAGRGGSRRISVFLDVLEPVAKPVLLVETQALDFGKLRVGARGAPQVIRVANRGSGELATATPLNSSNATGPASSSSPSTPPSPKPTPPRSASSASRRTRSTTAASASGPASATSATAHSPPRSPAPSVCAARLRPTAPISTNSKSPPAPTATSSSSPPTANSPPTPSSSAARKCGNRDNSARVPPSFSFFFLLLFLPPKSAHPPP